MLRAVLPHSANYCARALIMPNFKNPILTAPQAEEYRAEILTALKTNAPNTFQPLMTIYLTEETTLADFGNIESPRNPEESIFAAKLYFAGATTNSQHGITKIARLFPLFEQMEKHDIPLSIHGEIANEGADIFDREKIFVERHLSDLLTRFPSLRITLEHITTKTSVDFIREHCTKPSAQPIREKRDIRLAATITPHHLLLNRNDLLSGGIRPHYYCLPILKREEDRLALVEAAASGEDCFFLGTDSAPHSIGDKESACGCAGIFNAPYALDCVLAATQPQSKKELERIERFTSVNGANFHNLELTESYFTLEKFKQSAASSPASSESTPDPIADIVPPSQRIKTRINTDFSAPIVAHAQRSPESLPPKIKPFKPLYRGNESYWRCSRPSPIPNPWWWWIVFYKKQRIG